MSVAAPTRDLARFAAELRFEGLPEGIVERVKDIILDTLASALAGHDASETQRLISFAEAIAPAGESTVIGGGRLSMGGATLANAYLITAVTVCDIHRPSHCHVTPEVVAPALVAGEAIESSGRDLLVAVAAGLEVTTRVGLGLKPAVFRARGWHSPGVTGPFGGAAAVGRLLRLDEEHFRNAFGIAGSQSAGSYAQLRTPTIKFQQARGALSGLLAAWLANTGFQAAQEILLHPDGGLFYTHSDGGQPQVVSEDLGTRWELESISLRAWPVAVHLQPLVTSLMGFVTTEDRGPAQIEEVRVDVSPSAYQMHGTVDWDDRFRARLSVPYVTGVVLHDHRCWLDQFTPTRVQDAGLGRFIRERVSVHADPELEDGTVRVVVRSRDGSLFEDYRRVAKGEPADPLTRVEIEEKFRSAGAGRISVATIDRVIDLVTGLEDLDGVGELMACLRR